MTAAKWFAKAAAEHKKADAACGRDWVCACAACRAARCAFIPACVTYDPFQLKNLNDAAYILQHEIDLAEEGEDGALTGPDIRKVRYALDQVMGAL